MAYFQILNGRIGTSQFAMASEKKVLLRPLKSPGVLDARYGCTPYKVEACHVGMMCNHVHSLKMALVEGFQISFLYFESGPPTYPPNEEKATCWAVVKDSVHEQWQAGSVALVARGFCSFAQKAGFCWSKELGVTIYIDLYRCYRFHAVFAAEMLQVCGKP